MNLTISRVLPDVATCGEVPSCITTHHPPPTPMVTLVEPHIRSVSVFTYVHAVQAATAPANDQNRHANRHSTPPRLPFWETQMTPHGHHPASRLAPPPAQPPPALPVVTPSTEVNAIGQPLPAQPTTAAAVVTEAAQRLEAQQATPAVAASSAGLRAKAGAGSSGAVAEAELVTPPGGFQPGQVWLNNVFSPELQERPRCEPSKCQNSLMCCCDSP